MPHATQSRKRTKLQPLGDQIVVQQEENEDRTAGGVFLPDSARDRPSRGVVVNVGNGRLLKDGTRASPQVQPGDKVIFDKFNMGDTFKIGEEEYLLISETDILGVIEE